METATRAQRDPIARRRASPALDRSPDARRRRRSRPHRGVGPDRVAGHRVPAEPVGPAPRHPVLLAPPLVHARTGDRRRPRAAVEPVRDVRDLVRRGPAERVALAAHDGLVVAVRLRRRAPGADRPEPDPGRPRAVLVPAEGGARADRGHRRRALARDGGLRLDPGDQPPVRRHARVDAVHPGRRVRVLRRDRVAAARVARARGVRVGSGRDLAPVARPGDGHGPGRRVRGRPRDPRGRDGARSAAVPRSGGRSRSSCSCRSRTSRSWSRTSRSSRGRAWPTGTARSWGRSRVRPATAEDVPIPATGMWGAWPLALASTPGGYLGAAVLLFVPFALRDAARRYLVVALGAVAVARVPVDEHASSSARAGSARSRSRCRSATSTCTTRAACATSRS